MLLVYPGVVAYDPAPLRPPYRATGVLTTGGPNPCVRSIPPITRHETRLDGRHA
jgi:hypothetical protein